jgi:pyridoxal phosphate enzyme (YggS family)
VTAIDQNLHGIQERIAAAARRAGRDPSAVTLVAVSKTHPPEAIEQAIAAGQLLFGESKIQEARAKIPAVSSRARWHLIGHLQSNKARDAVTMFELIHSVDSVRLAGEISKWAERAGKTQEILLEVNVSGEASKFGMQPEDVAGALEQINRLPRLIVRGLMTIAPYAEDPNKARPFFAKLRELRDRLGLTELSMGMTGDFEPAIEEGATIVRIGTAIFGERTKSRLREKPNEYAQ